MKCFEINNFVNEDDVVGRKSCPNTKNLSKMDKRLLESDRRQVMATLLEMMTNESRSAINNRLTSKTEIMNLINTLRSSEFQKKFDAKRTKQWKTPLIEDFLPANDSQDSTTEELDWNNSELNYYKKDIVEHL